MFTLREPYCDKKNLNWGVWDTPGEGVLKNISRGEEAASNRVEGLSAYAYTEPLGRHESTLSSIKS